jgi:hypothetical protein
VYVSMNRGGAWQPFMNGLPTVPVHDLRIHPRERELIAGTHGRAIWIADVAPLQEMTAATLAKATHVFAPRTAMQYGEVPMEGQSTGNKYWAAPSPAYGALVSYRIAPGTKVDGPVRIAVLGPMGDTLRAYPNAPSTAGVHTILWDMRGRPATRTLSPAERRDSIMTARRTIAIVDSMVSEKIVPQPLGERVKTALNSGEGLQQLMAQFGGGGGGGFGGGGGGANARGTITPVGMPRFVERPGETGGAAGAGARGESAGEAAGESAGAAGAAAAPAGGGDQSAMMQLFQAIQASQRRAGRGGGGFGGGGAPFVPTGTYLVAVTINGETTKVPLRVERMNGTDGSGPAFGGEEDGEGGREP